MQRYTLRQWRKLNDKTMQEMADFLDISTKTYAHMEKNIRKAKLEKVILAARLLGINTEQIKTEEDGK